MAFLKLKCHKVSLLVCVGSFLLFSFLVFANPSRTLAANSCEFTRAGNFSLVASTCKVTAGTIDGIDAGNLTVGANKTITIESGAQLVISTGYEIQLAQFTHISDK